jgi:hypothetical protein
MWARRCSESWNGSGRSGSRSMNMDDHFLHQLRRDPPAGFAARLKWQLDRPAPTRASRARLLLVFAIFGTAFAIVSPHARRLFGDLFDRTERIAQTPAGVSGIRQAPPAASTGMSGDTKRPPRNSLSRTGSAVPKSPGGRSRCQRKHRTTRNRSGRLFNRLSRHPRDQVPSTCNTLRFKHRSSGPRRRF